MIPLSPKGFENSVSIGLSLGIIATTAYAVFKILTSLPTLTLILYRTCICFNLKRKIRHLKNRSIGTTSGKASTANRYSKFSTLPHSALLNRDATHTSSNTKR